MVGSLLRQHRLIITVREWISIHLNCFYKKNVPIYVHTQTIPILCTIGETRPLTTGEADENGEEGEKTEAKKRERYGKGNHSQTDINKNDQKH